MTKYIKECLITSVLLFLVFRIIDNLNELHPKSGNFVIALLVLYWLNNSYFKENKKQ
jgi:glycerol uptake facilitator-like aquaporin